ncbi:hypothetical protein DMC64_19935 [Amycolatopsis sp. WAC 04197]|uniref:pentapeptide repeat-containing protein n=1 Tax=Amycolatopsis sp. WAC 04197 TaxID=2203199 RepID=UPI000F79F076|nr:pentapeptide repeat-containing protein [Amycolatopsis sp. WAC 04197]RSN45118.1 hypothetical protein DMC64_19935 [Amycolatopsis sp. WAC 04197]
MSARNKRHNRNRRRSASRTTGRTETRSSTSKNEAETAKKDGKQLWGNLISLVSALVATGAVAVSCLSAKASQQSAQASLQQVGITERGQFDDRFNRAVQQLGNRDSIDIRQGGIHSLESLLQDSPRHHPTIIKLLASFIREHSPISECTEEKRVPNDIRTAIGVIGRHIIKPDTKANEYSVDLRFTCLSGVDFVGLDFTRAFLAGSDLSGADLTESNFTGAYLLSARLDQGNAMFANFTCTVLANANLQKSWLVGAQFVGADLVYANLADAKLEAANLADAILHDAIIDPKQLENPAILKTPPNPFCLADAQYPQITRG